MAILREPTAQELSKKYERQLNNNRLHRIVELMKLGGFTVEDVELAYYEYATPQEELQNIRTQMHQQEQTKINLQDGRFRGLAKSILTRSGVRGVARYLVNSYISTEQVEDLFTDKEGKAEADLINSIINAMVDILATREKPATVAVQKAEIVGRTLYGDKAEEEKYEKYTEEEEPGQEEEEAKEELPPTNTLEKVSPKITVSRKSKAK